MDGILLLGEALVDMISPDVGTDLAHARTFVKAAGGAVANVAVGLARLGARGSFAGAVGDDPFGQFVRGYLADQGVDVRWLRVLPDYPTGVVFVCLDADRVPSFCFYGAPSADMMYGPELVEPAMLDGVGWLHCGTVSMVREESRAATWKLLDLARTRATKICFDPNLRLHLWRDHARLRETAQRTAAQADLVKLNRDELEFLTGEAEPAAGARALRALGPAAVVVTLGPQGAYFQGPEGEGREPGVVVAAVDTTGAGDAFAAGLLAALAGAAWPPDAPALRSAVRQANACGALATTALGATAGLARAEELAEFLRGRRG